MPDERLPTTIRSTPSVADYTPLADYQSQTPSTFVGGRPVLYFHSAGAKAYVPVSQREQLPFFPTDGAQDGESAEDGAEKMVEQTVDLFVNSETFTIFSPSSSVGLEIPYPTIGIQAIRTFTPPSGTPSRSVYMQLNLNDGGADDETYDTVELTLVLPSAAATAPADNTSTSSSDSDTTTALFSALSTCQDLHPDPDDDSDASYDDDDRIVFESAFDNEPEALSGFTGVYRGAGDGGLPPPMPGSATGWITAENVHEFFDEEGNWIAANGNEEEGEQLGEGAGRVRGRDEVEEEEKRGNGENGESDGVNGSRDDEESKRPRRE